MLGPGFLRPADASAFVSEFIETERTAAAGQSPTLAHTSRTAMVLPMDNFISRYAPPVPLRTLAPPGIILCVHAHGNDGDRTPITIVRGLSIHW